MKGDAKNDPVLQDGDRIIYHHCAKELGHRLLGPVFAFGVAAIYEWCFQLRACSF